MPDIIVPRDDFTDTAPTVHLAINGRDHSFRAGETVTLTDAEYAAFLSTNQATQTRGGIPLVPYTLVVEEEGGGDPTPLAVLDFANQDYTVGGSAVAFGDIFTPDAGAPTFDASGMTIDGTASDQLTAGGVLVPILQAAHTLVVELSCPTDESTVLDYSTPEDGVDITIYRWGNQLNPSGPGFDLYGGVWNSADFVTFGLNFDTVGNSGAAAIDGSAVIAIPTIATVADHILHLERGDGPNKFGKITIYPLLTDAEMQALTT